jgi:uncharacterized protein (TIRG00374 family)
MDRARNLLRPLLLWLTAGCLAYAAFGLVLGWRDFRLSLARFPLDGIPLLVGLSLANYLLRFGRWSGYLSRLSLRVPRRESWAVFFATFAMVVTPGKLGEIYKAVHLREKRGIPLSAGLSVLIAERLSDVLAVLLLAAAGLCWWDGPLGGTVARLGALLIVALTVATLRSGKLQETMISRLSRVSRLHDRGDEVRDALQRLPAVTSGRTGAVSLLLSVAAWFCECLSLWFICERLGLELGLGPAVFIYAAATLAGSVALLPGGLGGTEAVLVVLLASQDVPRGAALSVALLVRLATLWLAVLIGLGVFAGARHILFDTSRADD